MNTITSRSTNQFLRPTLVIATAALSLATLTACDVSSGSSSLDPTTCKDLIPQIIKLSQDNSTANNGGTIIAIYRPRLIADHIKAFNDGTFKIPAGKNDVNVLDCSGQATANDGSTGGINYQLSIDTNGQQFVAFQPR